MLDYSEKRDFIRMPVQCPVSLRDIDRETTTVAELQDLSAGGVRFISEQPLEAGQRLRIRVQPEYPVTPPLQADISVLRCNPLAGNYSIAATIQTVEPAAFGGEE
jgi:hypothetical protein